MAVSVVPTLLLAAHTVFARPFAPEFSWKGPVRAALLLLAAACAAVQGWARAIDVGLSSGGAAAVGLTAAAYAIIVIFCLTVGVLVVSVGLAMPRGARAEQAAIVEALEAAARDISARRHVPLVAASTQKPQSRGRSSNSLLVVSLDMTSDVALLDSATVSAASAAARAATAADSNAVQMKSRSLDTFRAQRARMRGSGSSSSALGGARASFRQPRSSSSLAPTSHGRGEPASDDA